MNTSVTDPIEQQLLIRIYGDSLSLPRSVENVSYLQTYAEQLVAAWRRAAPERQVHLYNRSYADATAPTIERTTREDAFYFGPAGAEVAVLQCGIVDCAPRPVPNRVRALIGRLPSPLRDAVIRILHNQRARMIRCGMSWRRTAPSVFLASVRTIVGRLADEFSRVYVINIAPTNAVTEAHSPGLSLSIRLYNELLARAVAEHTGRGTVEILDVHTAILACGGVDRYISTLDGHHLTPAGHDLYARLLLLREIPAGPQ